MMVWANMKILELQFRVQNRPGLDAETRSSIMSIGGFPPISLSRCTQIWRVSIPNQIRMSINVHGAAVFITDDWITSIYGRRLIDCVGASCAIVSVLGEVCGASVTVNLLTTHGVGDETSLERQLERERKQAWLWAGVRYTLTLIFGSGLGVLIQYLLF
jgi:hypothetical protein